MRKLAKKENLVSLLLALVGLMGVLLSGCSSTSSRKLAGPNVDRPSRSFYVEGVTSRSMEQSFSTERCQVGMDLKERDWKSLVRIANGCLKTGNWKGVEEVGQYLARTDLESPWGAYYMGLVAEHEGDVPRALWMIDLALKKSGGSVSLFRYQRGRLMWSLKQYDMAFAEVKAAVSVEPSLLEGHLFLADVYARDLEVSLAKKHYQKALELSPGNGRAQRGLASLDVEATSSKETRK